MLRQSSGGRYRGVAVLGGVVSVVVAVALIYALRTPDKPKAESAPSVGSSSDVQSSGVKPPVAGQGPGSGVGSGTAAVAAVSRPEDATVATIEHNPKPPPVKPPDSAGDKALKATHCQELEAQKDWQGLRDCAGQLAVLGSKDRAEEFRVKAVKEAANALADDKVRKAIRDGNFKEAQRLLKGISQESVYWAKLNEAFKTSETRAAEDNKKTAQSLATLSDCAALKRFQLQLASSPTGTPAVLAAVNVKCVDMAAAVPPPPVDNNPRQPIGSGGDTAQNLKAAPTPPKNSICEGINVQDMIGQAQNQFTAGFAKAALQLLIKALACKQDVKMYRMAATYACVAHDAENARIYSASVPVQFRAAIIQRCQQEGIALP